MSRIPDPASPDWRAHLLEDEAAIHALLRRVRRIAVLGIKPPETRAAAYYVPAYAKSAGYTIIPVPVYYPEVKEILGEPVQRALRDVPRPIDLIDVFRRPGDIPPHVEDMLAVRPSAVWFQLGIRNDEAAEQLARAGIDVVQDRCLMVDLRNMGR